MQYQVQEMLRVERIFEAADIQAMIDDWKAGAPVTPASTLPAMPVTAPN